MTLRMQKLSTQKTETSPPPGVLLVSRQDLDNKETTSIVIHKIIVQFCSDNFEKTSLKNKNYTTHLFLAALQPQCGGNGWVVVLKDVDKDQEVEDR